MKLGQPRTYTLYSTSGEVISNRLLSPWSIPSNNTIGSKFKLGLQNYMLTKLQEQLEIRYSISNCPIYRVRPSLYTNYDKKSGLGQAFVLGGKLCLELGRLKIQVAVVPELAKVCMTQQFIDVLASASKKRYVEIIFIDEMKNVILHFLTTPDDPEDVDALMHSVTAGPFESLKDYNRLIKPIIDWILIGKPIKENQYENG
jgi:hypothetical protein